MTKSKFSYLKLTAAVAVLAIAIIGLNGLFSRTTVAREKSTAMPREIASNLMDVSPTTTQAGQSCDPPITINEVRYLGKSSGDDDVRVLWTVGGSCLSVNGSFKVQVRVIRKLGHVDIASAIHVLNGPQQNTLVRIKRGLTETDPKEYEVTITGSAGHSVFRTETTPVEVTLAEASGPGKTFPVAQSADLCAPTTTITKIAYEPNTRVVKVGSNVSSACLKPFHREIVVSLVTQAADQPEKETALVRRRTDNGFGDIGPFSGNFVDDISLRPAGTSNGQVIRIKVQGFSHNTSAPHNIFISKVGNF